MIPIAKNIYDAIRLLKNNSLIFCVSKYGSITVSNIDDAVYFFGNKPKKKRNKIRPIK